MTQNIYFLALAGLQVEHAFDVNIGGFALAFLVMPLTWIYMDRVGRRRLYLVGVVGNIITMGVIGGLGFVSISNIGAIWAVAVLMNLLITWQQPTISMVSWSLTPELSSYRLRQHTQSITIMAQAFTSWLFAFVTPYMYNVGKGSGNLGAKTGFVYMGCSIVLLIWAYFWIPEVRGLSTDDIDGMYERRVKPRMWQKQIKRKSYMRDDGEVELKGWNQSESNGSEGFASPS